MDTGGHVSKAVGDVWGDEYRCGDTILFGEIIASTSACFSNEIRINP